MKIQLLPGIICCFCWIFAVSGDFQIGVRCFFLLPKSEWFKVICQQLYVVSGYVYACSGWFILRYSIHRMSTYALQECRIFSKCLTELLWHPTVHVHVHIHMCFIFSFDLHTHAYKVLYAIHILRLESHLHILHYELRSYYSGQYIYVSVSIYTYIHTYIHIYIHI